MPACADYINVTDKLNVRASAQLNSKIIDTLPRNHYVAVQYKNDDWAYIEYYSKILQSLLHIHNQKHPK